MVIDQQEYWGDIYKVDGHTAAHCHANVLKSLESIGVPHWLKQQEKFKEIAELNPDGSLKKWKSSPPKHWTIFAATTDAGGDAQKTRDMGNWMTSIIPFVLWFENACALHQVHALI